METVDRAGRKGLPVSMQGALGLLFVKKVQCGGYILVNRRTGGHAHFDDYEGACRVRDWIRRRKMPRNPWFQESVRRVCTRKQWDAMRRG